MRLLLIDDHASFLETLAAMLSDTPGMEVVGLANNGAEGLRLAAKLQPDVVIVDFAMPGMDGLTVTRTIKSQPGSPKVIMMSVHSDREYRDMALAMGADSFLTKPCLYKGLVPLLTRLGKETG
jgi:DNA-binding NarL/FixJ family response regulator